VTIPPWLAGHQRQYRAAVVDLIRQADEEQSRAAHWQALGRATIGGTFLIVPIVLLALPPIATAVTLVLLTRQGVIANFTAKTILAPAMIAAGLLGVGLMVGYFLWGRERHRGLALGERAVACPSCAGLNRLAGGQAAHACHYCGASLAPSKTVVLNVLAEAQQQVHRQRLLRYRNERVVRSRFTDWFGRSFSIVRDFRLLLVVGLFLIGGAAHQAHNQRQKRGVLAASGAYLMVALSYGGWRLAARTRERRLDAAFTGLAEQFGGEVLRGRREVLGWLDRLWAGPVADFELSTSRRHRAVAARSNGYHLLLELQPDSTWFGALVGQRRLVLRVATELTALPKSAELDGLRSWLRDASFSLDAQEGGLTLRGSSELLKSIRREPELLLGLAPVLIQAGQLAQVAGASVVEPVAV
jgi:hypothetical protein